MIIPIKGTQNSFGMLSSSSKNVATSSGVLSLSIIKKKLKEIDEREREIEIYVKVLLAFAAAKKSLIYAHAH